MKKLKMQKCLTLFEKCRKIFTERWETPCKKFNNQQFNFAGTK